MTVVYISKPVLEAPLDPPAQEHLWYDDHKKEMLRFNCSHLNFEYKLDDSIDPPQYRSLPVPVYKDAPAIKSTNKYDTVDKWFAQYENYNHTKAHVVSVNPKAVSFEVPESEVDSFTYDLERRGFQYDTR